MNGEAVKNGGKYLCQLITTAERSSAEAVKTAGENYSIFKQRSTDELKKVIVEMVQ